LQFPFITSHPTGRPCVVLGYAWFFSQMGGLCSFVLSIVSPGFKKVSTYLPLSPGCVKQLLQGLADASSSSSGNVKLKLAVGLITCYWWFVRFGRS
jgi:hypothetical protein